MSNEELEKEELTKEEKKKQNIKSIITWCITIIMCLGVAKLFTTFVVSSVEVEGHSMSTTLSDGDKALTDAMFFKFSGIERFDIVIIKMKDGNYKGEKLVKRVIALPGETIEYKNGVLYINNREVKEDFIDDIVKKLTGTIKRKTLGEDEYFVLGDNRGNSSDSRYFGAVEKDEIIGRGILRFMVCVEKDGNNQCSKRKLIWPKSVK